MGGLAIPRRSGRRARWSRRIGGVLGTAGLLAAGAAIASMVLGDTGSATPPAATAPTGRAAAVAVLRAQGYVPVRHAGYDADHLLRVMIGKRGPAAHAPRRAFFFAGDEFVGHDADTPSRSLKVVRSHSRWLVLAYGRYARGDRACCPSRHPARVRFTWTGGSVLAHGTVPPAAQRSPRH